MTKNYEYDWKKEDKPDNKVFWEVRGNALVIVWWNYILVNKGKWTKAILKWVSDRNIFKIYFLKWDH